MASLKLIRYEKSEQSAHLSISNLPYLKESPHRGVSQDKLPIYVKFFEFIHNCRKRGKSLISSLIQVLVVNNKHPHASG